MSKSSIRFPGKLDEELESVQKIAERAVKRLHPLKIDKIIDPGAGPRKAGGGRRLPGKVAQCQWQLSLFRGM